MADRTVWARMAVGACVGLVIGFFVPPGTGFWVFSGVFAAYLAELWVRRRRPRSVPGTGRN